jgi:hypothetical protein
MIYFQTQIPILGKFWMVLKWKVLAYFMVLCFLRPFGTFYGHLVYFGIVCYFLYIFWNVLQRKIRQNWNKVYSQFRIKPEAQILKNILL